MSNHNVDPELTKVQVKELIDDASSFMVFVVHPDGSMIKGQAFSNETHLHALVSSIRMTAEVLEQVLASNMTALHNKKDGE